MTNACPSLRATAAGVLVGIALWAGFSLAPAPVRANDSIIEQQTSGLDVDELDDTDLGFRNGSLIVAPIPFSNPMIGSGLILGAGYLFQFDPQSDPSVIGLGGLRSDNGSQAVAAAVSLNFNSNRWKMSLGGGTADVKYDLYDGNLIIPLRQDGVLARLTLAYGLTPDLNFGLVSRYLDTTITTQSSLFPNLPPAFQPSADLTILNAGLEANWDKRDDTVYPTDGFRVKLSSQRGFIVDGIGADYNKTYGLFDSYVSLGENTVIASRAAVCHATDAAPFFDACSLGGVDSFRGFNATQILNKRSMSTQLELRQSLSDRIGAVLFAGIGAAGPTFDNLNQSGAAGGFGLRYRVSKKFPVDFSVDGSWNDEHEGLLYISIGQRF